MAAPSSLGLKAFIKVLDEATSPTVIGAPARLPARNVYNHRFTHSANGRREPRRLRVRLSRRAPGIKEIAPAKSSRPFVSFVATIAWNPAGACAFGRKPQPKSVTTMALPFRSIAEAEKPVPDWRDTWSAVVAVVAVGAASRIAQVATFPNFSDWYEGLAKPGFTPPDEVFGYVWGPLYLLMALAFWRIRSLPADMPGRHRAIALFLAQLALGALWSVAFFRAQSPGLGFVDIVLQGLVLIATIRAFWPLDRWSAIALVPLAIWIGFVALLDLAVWRLNA